MPVSISAEVFSSRHTRLSPREVFLWKWRLLGIKEVGENLRIKGTNNDGKYLVMDGY